MTRSEKPGARPAIGCDGADEDRPSKAPRTDQIWQDNCRSKSAAGAIGSLGIGAATATEPSEATMWALSLKRRSRTRSISCWALIVVQTAAIDQTMTVAAAISANRRRRSDVIVAASCSPHRSEEHTSELQSLMRIS